jgi:nitroreductase
MTYPRDYEAVARVVSARKSIRSFLPNPVDKPLIQSILDVASRAPSGQNMQPWQVHVVTGATREKLCEVVTAAADAGERSDDYAYFPKEIQEPYLSRRRKVGYDLFSVYGIERDDLAGRKRALLRNFQFFDAPVGLFFTMRRDWGYGAWIDIGMYMMNVITLARAAGLETCCQQAWSEYGQAVRQVLDIPLSDVIVSGMAIGYADLEARENGLITDRAPLDQFVQWHAHAPASLRRPQ